MAYTIYVLYVVGAVGTFAAASWGTSSYFRPFLKRTWTFWFVAAVFAIWWPVSVPTTAYKAWKGEL